MNAVLEEHQEYFSLTGRYDRYRDAIAKTVSRGDIVADLGCGFGVLGVQCLHAGAAHAYGIDHSAAIDVARETMQHAGLADRYTCIRASTFQCELPQRVDLIICDHVGYFGFDYGIVSMLADARKRMLKPDGKIMPRRLHLQLAGVTSDTSRRKADFWASAEPSEYRWLAEHGRNIKRQASFDPKDICTATALLGEIDLMADHGDSLGFEAELLVTRDGTFDGLAGWFDCELAEDVWMTNSPLDPQAIERPQAFLAADQPFAVQQGDKVQVKLRITDDADTISWIIVPPGNGKRQKMSTWKSRLFSSLDLGSEVNGVASLTAGGEINRAILELVDGQRTVAQIEDEILERYAPKFPNLDYLRRIVRRELSRNADVDHTD